MRVLYSLVSPKVAHKGCALVLKSGANNTYIGSLLQDGASKVQEGTKVDGWLGVTRHSSPLLGL